MRFAVNPFAQGHLTVEQRVRRWRPSFQRSRGQRFRYALSLRLLGAALIGVGLLVLGCCSDPVANYHMLAFFFDGVPVPPELAGTIPQPVEGPWGILLDPDDPRAKAILARAKARQDRKADGEVIQSVHLPFRDRLCTECHSRSTSFDVAIAADTCRKCHGEYYALKADDWVHGPVALGKCSMCHVSHTSKYKGLLAKPQRDQCFFCHDAGRTLAATYHSQAETKSCSTCHDPHSAGNPLLLADAMTYARRKRRPRPAPSGHAEWDKSSCTTCHVAAESNKLVPDVDVKCLACHKKVQDSAGPGRLHKPVREGKCTVCHMAHKSQGPKLTRRDVERACFSCHKLEELQNGVHPPMRRADCLLCHNGHTSSRKHLLNALGGASLQSRRRPGDAPGRRAP